MDTLIQEKIKRRGTKDDAASESKKPKLTELETEKRKDVELKLLVKNVKRKTQEMNQRKK